MSAEHATVHRRSEAKETRYWLLDRGSTNGTWVGGVRLSRNGQRLIGDGDLVQIGAFTLQVAVSDDALDGEPSSADAGGTGALALDWLGAFAVRPFPSIRVVEGPDAGARLELLESGRVYSVGRGDEAALAVADPGISREHFSIVRRDERVFVRDGGSKHGISLGRDRLPGEAEVLWRPALHLRAGGSVLALEPATPAVSADGALPEVVTRPGASAEAAAPVLARADLRGSDGDSPRAPGGPRPFVAKGRSRKVGPTALVAAVILVLALSVVGLVWIASAHSP